MKHTYALSASFPGPAVSLLLIISVIAALIFASPLAGAGDGSKRLQGRDFVTMGELETVTGTLSRERGEWFLAAGGVLHELHLGDHDHRAATGIRLEAGKQAEVTGFAYRQQGSDIVDIAVCSITLDGQEYQFRTEDGTPLWRGSGGGDKRGGGR